MKSTAHIISRVSERTAQVALYGVLLTPLLVASSSLVFPFITTKVFFFRSVIIIALAASIAYMGTRIFRYGGALGAGILAYFVIAFLSAVFGVDFHRSWWGNHERMVGLFTVLHGIIYFFLLTAYICHGKGTVLQAPIDRWRPYLIAAAGVSTAVSFFGVLQRSGVEIFFAPPGGRAWSSLGNFIYLATFSSFFLWVLALLALTERRRAFLVAYLIAAVFHVLAFIYAESRGAYIGLAVGIVAASGASLIFLRARIRRIVLAILSVLILIVVLTRATGDTRLVRKTPVLRNIAQISLSDVTAQTRLHAWRVGVTAWKERPLLGWGYENFYYAFNRFFDPRVLRYSVYETWFDNAHNVLVNTAATTGMFGLIAYLGIFAVAVFLLVRAMRQGAISRPLFVVCIGLVATYFGNNFFVFDHPSSYVTFFMMLALVATITRARAVEAPAVEGRTRVHMMRALLAALGALFLIFRTNVQPMAANAATLNAVRATQEGPRETQIAFERALALATPHRVDVLSDLARQTFAFYAAAGDTGETRQLLDFALTLFEQVPSGAARDVQFLLAKAQLYALKGAHEPVALDRAMEVVRAVIALSPARQQVYSFAARIALAKGDAAAARAFGETIVSLDPEAGPAYWMRAQIFEALQEHQRALDDVRSMLARTYRPTLPQDHETFLRIVYGVHVASASRETVIAALKDDPGLLYMLGSAYAASGRVEDMYATAKFMQEIGVSDDLDPIIRAMTGQ